MKRFLTGFCGIFLLCSTLFACVGALQRGMLGNTYISTARPAIALSVPSLPLMMAGQGMPNMQWTGMAGGLPINVWLAVYGQGGLAPMAIVAQAQTPQGWYWDSGMSYPFSVDQGSAVFNNVTYEAWTSIVYPENDPFDSLYTAAHPDGAPQLWVARTYAARYNFNDDKIILQYREPLPENITSLTELPYGQADFLAQFRERAQSVFSVADCPDNPQDVKQGYANAIRWQYMNQNFLGNVSRNYTLYDMR